MKYINRKIPLTQEPGKLNGDPVVMHNETNRCDVERYDLMSFMLVWDKCPACHLSWYLIDKCSHDKQSRKTGVELTIRAEQSP